MTTVSLLTTLLILTAESSEPIAAPPMVPVEASTLKTIQRGDATHPERFKLSRPAPPGFHVASELNWRLTVTGIAVFTAAYLPFAVIGPATYSPVAAVPFIGPFLAFRPTGGFLGVFADAIIVVGIFSAVSAQVSGVIMTILGLTIPRQWLERDVTKPTTPTISFAPMAPGADLGASVVGRF